MKTLLFLFLLLNTENWFLSTVSARDFGVQGKIAPIEEEDPLQFIHQKLKTMEERGELERHNKALQKKAVVAVERPKPVEEITKAKKPRIFYYDPTYIVNADITDHQGRVFIKKGTKVNPLETVTLSQNLLFLDGDDEEQKNFAKEKLQQRSLTLVLIKGEPLTLSEKFRKRVYFDQGGILIQKLGIKNVPALVTQEGKKLRIEEVYPLQVSPPNREEELEVQSRSKDPFEQGLSEKVPSGKVSAQKISVQKTSVQKAQLQIKGSQK